jgi:hypothetical protein
MASNTAFRAFLKQSKNLVQRLSGSTATAGSNPKVTVVIGNEAAGKQSSIAKFTGFKKLI